MKEKNEGRHGPAKRFSRLPPLVVSRAKSAGPAGEKTSTAPSPGRSADRQKARDGKPSRAFFFSLSFSPVFSVSRWAVNSGPRNVLIQKVRKSCIMQVLQYSVRIFSLSVLGRASPSAPPDQDTVLVSVLKVSTSSRIMKQSSPTMTRAKASETSVTPAAVQTFQIP